MNDRATEMTAEEIERVQMYEKRSYLKDTVDRVVCLEQMAEEAMELGNAALKLVRVLNGVNPTPVTVEEAEAKLLEEWTDLVVVGSVYGAGADYDIYNRKLNRWYERVKKMQEGAEE